METKVRSSVPVKVFSEVTRVVDRADGEYFRRFPFWMKYSASFVISPVAGSICVRLVSVGIPRRFREDSMG